MPSIWNRENQPLVRVLMGKTMTTVEIAEKLRSTNIAQLEEQLNRLRVAGSVRMVKAAPATWTMPKMVGE